MKSLPTRNAAEKLILYAISIGALELIPEGRELKSKRLSPYFFNSGKFSTGEALSILADAYVAAIPQNMKPDVIFGPAYKGITLAAAVAMKLEGDVGFAFNRKEEKDHGEGGTIVGASMAGKRVLIVDDVMTTGSSSAEAVSIIRANGGIPIGCIVGCDRQERGEKTKLSAVQEFQLEFDIQVYAAFSLTDLIGFLKQGPEGSFAEENLIKILAYQEEYGAW